MKPKNIGPVKDWKKLQKKIGQIVVLAPNDTGLKKIYPNLYRKYTQIWFIESIGKCHLLFEVKT